MAYDEVLQFADRLGFQLPSSTRDSVQTQLDALQLVEKHRGVHGQELKLQTLSGYVHSRDVTDQQLLQSRANSMKDAADTFQNICTTKDAIADRLRSAKTRPSVPVAPEYQPDFSALLQHSASSAGMLHDGVASLQWAASLDDKPSCWEDQLKCILDAAKEISGSMTAMEQFSSALVISSNTGRVQ